MTGKKSRFDDLFDGISQFGSELADLFRDPFGGDLFGTAPEKATPGPNVAVTAEEAHRQALVQMFNHRNSGEKERAFLGEAVEKYASEVLASGNDQLVKAHAKAAVWIGDLTTATTSFQEVQKQTPRLHEARGLVLYTLGRFPSAGTQFKAAEDALSNPGRLAYAAAMFQSGDASRAAYQTLLGPLLERNSKANAIIGVVAARMEDYTTAERYLRSAVQIDPRSEQTQLDLMRVLVLAGRSADAYAAASQFYVQTGSQKDQLALNGELEGRPLTVRPFRIANISPVIDSLV